MKWKLGGKSGKLFHEAYNLNNISPRKKVKSNNKEK